MIQYNFWGRYETFKEMKKDGTISKIWNTAFEAQKLQDLLMYPKKILSDRIETSEEKYYYYAVIASEDRKSIILCDESANTKDLKIKKNRKSLKRSSIVCNIHQ